MLTVLRVRKVRVLMVLAVLAMAGSALAQPRPGTGIQPQPRPTAPTTGGATSANVPDSKVAVIDSAAFQDEKQGPQAMQSLAR